MSLSRQERALRVRCLLLEKFGKPHWGPSDPLDELIQTVLSQNTNDRNRDRAYSEMRRKFPSWEMVRDADSEALVNTIRYAGLANQKGPRIQAILKLITEQQGNLSLEFLREMAVDEVREWLMSLNGVGPKTASIVMVFSLGLPAFPVDTHVYRVSGRIGLRDALISVEETHQAMEDLFPADSYGELHMNLIRLGRDICHARKPNCSECPVKDICSYNMNLNNPSVSLQ